ncbi:glycerophosphodiester phosphodiesterase family protein [Desulfopila sp. IMCC35008]|uniref:glycerophosphodiester phosphodiesterase n=1 Tax=Desulfopila sp. IMCC35008 TaxID=2653858 RepID=UPI0021061EE3|nr:glycerophosphodiester phosphodiesterase family protein [Desulfopila sp. IMCC35008]
MNYFEFSHKCLPKIGAHRGYRSIRPENTLSAFKASLGHCHFIELDVQMSRDGVAVIHHDDELGRTNNPGEYKNGQPGSSMRVDTWDLDSLRKLDFGSWFLKADPFKTLEKGLVLPDELKPILPQPLMTLKELLSWRNTVGIPLNIEIKDQQGHHHDSIIVDKVLEAIREAGCTDQILISSFRHDYLKQIVKKMPEIPIGVLQEENNPEDLLQYLATLGAAAYHPDIEIISEELIHTLRQSGFGVNIFTVNNPNDQKRLLRAGASSVITDFPVLAIAESTAV